MIETDSAAQVKLAVQKEISRWRRDSVYAVRQLFTLTPHPVEPDPAQILILEAFNDPSKQRLAMKACKGPGKTCTLAWCCWIFLATRPHAQIAACSISRDNLKDNLWKELATWYQRSKYLQVMFEITQTRIFARKFPGTWWISARSWAKCADKTAQDNTMAGLHADYTMAVLDEVGGIPDGVEATAEGSLSTVGGEHRILMAGNPTHLEGPLYRACTTERHLWTMVEITGDPADPHRSTRISIKWANEQIAKYGRENPWVLVNVFGQFPPSSINALLGPDEMNAAIKRYYEASAYAMQSKVIGIDVGRFGGARSVIFPRQGQQAFTPVVLRPNRSERDWTGAFAARIVQAHNKWTPDGIFIDASGGWAGGVVDGCRRGGVEMFEVFVGAPGIDRRYKNRRAEVLFKAAEWVKGGGALPDLPELVREATATTYTFVNGVFVVEDKEQVKEKLGGESPDLWDAFGLTFSQEVAPRQGIRGLSAGTAHAKTEPDEE